MMQTKNLIKTIILSTLVCLFNPSDVFSVPTPPTPTKIEKQQEIKTTDNKQTEKKKSTQEDNITQDKIDAFEDIRNQAKLLYNANKPDEAIEQYKKIPDSEKTSEDWVILANISQDNSKIIDAVFFLKKAIQADDKNYKAHDEGNICNEGDIVRIVESKPISGGKRWTLAEVVEKATENEIEVEE